MIEERDLQLPCEAASVPAARHFAKTVLAGWRVEGEGNTHATIDVLLVVSELVANAVRFCGTDVRLALRRTATAVEVVVGDDNPVLPVVGTPTVASESGRGLLIVASVSSDWGVKQRPDNGKDVWALVPVGG